MSTCEKLMSLPAVVLCALNISCCHVPVCLVLTETHQNPVG